MSGVFSIPFKYVLQRWTNAAESRLPISEKLESVQTKTRRLNDLCRRAVILGEEGSISQESYKIALGAIKDALVQCENVNNGNGLNGLRGSSCMSVGVCEEEGVGMVCKEAGINLNVEKLNKGVKRGVNGKGKSNVDCTMKEKVTTQPEVVNIGIDATFHQMELPNTRLLQLHNMMPPHLQGVVVPTMFHNVASTQFHNVASAQIQNSRLPH
ncbi:hypothetical protein L2E82_28858 [Cichorium intybus]|uniref:Uncharacterized protein n=1 Tax=Cichorium intybus TaxID=13427 RepID=A0ACB9CX44_CICIN|nr:hypothetical protein L2E82_28858 [Cichorium intybus]